MVGLRKIVDLYEGDCLKILPKLADNSVDMLLVDLPYGTYEDSKEKALITAKKVIEGKNPDRLVRLAVKRMIPSGPLGRRQLSSMKVYVGSSHPHEAQNPKVLNIKELVYYNERYYKYRNYS